ncbi:MAG TPA: prepilin peptidase [Candidatus Saccharimonadales bacterium]|nr:prepilin peptidase [Candidatus Saccharimonadales bacterium]
MILVALLILGLILGSFINVLVERMHAGQDFVHGRSHCDHCGHELAVWDLVPVLSWLSLAGRCRYCKAKVSWQHPAVEIIAGLLFAASYYWWPLGFSNLGSKALFAAWLISLVGLTALAIYDLKWMLLPSKIIYPTFAVAAAGRLIYLVTVEDHKPHALLLWAGSIVVASGFFLVLYIISQGKWIGYGDVRLGLVTGTLLAAPALSFLMIFLASVAGTLIAVPLLTLQKKNLSSRLPYGPFLIMATAVVMIFGQSLLDWYNRVLGG